MRKIIQITTTAVENTNTTQCHMVLYALCDDGSLWARYDWHNWERVPDIPQETPEASE